MGVVETRQPTSNPDLPYRSTVGMLVFSRHGLVWVGRRRPKWATADQPPFWQMPQGGIHDHETPEKAAQRELEEETGIRSAEIVGSIPQWLSYDLPDELLGVAMKGRYRGQRQRWFAIAFTGPDSEIDIRARRGRKAEFDAWQWVPLSEVEQLIVPFKRTLYATVAREFEPLVHRPAATPHISWMARLGLRLRG